MTFLDGHFPFCVAEVAEDGEPFEVWDGTTYYTPSLTSTPSKSSSELVTVVGDGTNYPLKLTLDEVMSLYWQQKIIQVSVDWSGTLRFEVDSSWSQTVVSGVGKLFLGFNFELEEDDFAEATLNVRLEDPYQKVCGHDETFTGNARLSTGSASVVFLEEYLYEPNPIISVDSDFSAENISSYMSSPQSVSTYSGGPDSGEPWFDNSTNASLFSGIRPVIKIGNDYYPRTSIFASPVQSGPSALFVSTLKLPTRNISRGQLTLKNSSATATVWGSSGGANATIDTISADIEISCLKYFTYNGIYDEDTGEML
jgi:hypothetical protein